MTSEPDSFNKQTQETTSSLSPSLSLCCLQVAQVRLPVHRDVPNGDCGPRPCCFWCTQHHSVRTSRQRSHFQSHLGSPHHCESTLVSVTHVKSLLICKNGESESAVFSVGGSFWRSSGRCGKAVQQSVRQWDAAHGVCQQDEERWKTDHGHRTQSQVGEGGNERITSAEGRHVPGELLFNRLCFCACVCVSSD